jgi:hypothetical protein
MVQPLAASETDLVVGETLTVDSAPQKESENDHDSTLGDEALSPSTTSLSSTVTSFKTLHGRRYHVRLLHFFVFLKT